MQDGRFAPNTQFEDRLNQSNFGKGLVSTMNDASTSPTISKDDLFKILSQEGQQVNRAVPNPLQPASLPANVLDTSGRYDYQLPGEDNEDLQAQMQSNWNKAFNGITKGLQLATSTFIQGTAGLVYGLGKVISGEGMNSFYDNELSNALDTWNKNTENFLPNYYSAQEREAKWYEPANLFTANFLFDKLIKNAGFSVGALAAGGVVSAGIRGALSTIPLFNTVGRAAQAASAIEEGLSSVPPLQRLNTYNNIIQQASKAATSIGSRISGAQIDRTLTSFLGAATEGGIEALQGVNEWRNAKIAEYNDKYGYLPSGEDLVKINQAADELGNARFGMNIGLLTATNFIQLPKILGSRYSTSKALANTQAAELGDVGAITKASLDDSFKRAVPTRVGRLLNRTGNAATLFFSPSEAFEETSQYAIEKGLEGYFDKAYKGESRNLINSLLEGYGEALSTKEGIESLILGGLSGGLMQIRSNLNERGVFGEGGTRRVATDTFIDQLNKSQFPKDAWVRDMAESVGRGFNLMQENEKHIKDGDVLEVKDNEADQMINYLGVRIKHGRYDLVKDDIASLQQESSNPQGLEKLKSQGYADPNDTVTTFQTRLKTFSEQADLVNNLYQSLNLRYSGLVNQQGERVYSESTIDKMVYAAAKIADYDNRIPQLADSLNELAIPLQQAIEKIMNNGTVSEQDTRDSINIINNLTTDSYGRTVTSDQKDILKANLRDIIELGLRRKQYLKEYESIKKNPAQYEARTPINVDEGTFSAPQKDGRKKTTTDLEVGIQYSLTEPILREGNQIVVAPKITPISQTLRGEIETVLPTGQTTFLPLSDFRDYRITTASNDSDTIATEFAESVRKVVGKDKFANLQDSLAQVDQTPEEIQKWLNNQDNKDLTDAVVRDLKPKITAIQEQIKKEQEEAIKLANDQKKANDIAKDQQTNNTTSADVIPPDGGDLDVLNAEDNSNKQKKAPIQSFLSKEADYYDKSNPKPHQKRRLTFLTHLARVLGMPNSNKIKVLAITQKNEGKYGLSGLYDFISKDTISTLIGSDRKSQYLDENNNFLPSQQPIIKLYILQDKGKNYLISQDGKKLSELKGNITQEAIDQGVFGLFHSNIGTYSFSEQADQKNYVGTEEQEKLALTSLQTWREKVLNMTDAPVYSIQGVSRGIVQRDTEDKPVLQTSLITEKDLNRENLITVPTRENQITINDVSLNFPVGRPLLTLGSNVEFLNNRQFSPKEAENIYNLLMNVAQGNEKERILNYLRSILYMRDQVGQIYFQNTNIVMGDMKIPFSPTFLEKNKSAIITYVSSLYQKTNNKYLTNQPYEEAYIQDGLKFRSYPSYQHYLLNPVENVPFLRTKAIRQIAADDPSIISRYTTLQDNEFVLPNPVVQPTTTTQPTNSVRDLLNKKKQTKVDPQEEPVNLVKNLLSKKKAKPTVEETKQVEQKASEGKKPQDRRPPKGTFRLAPQVRAYKAMDIQKELAYIQAKTPFDTKLLNEIIQTPEGLYAWGQYKDMTISLYNKAQEGTGYHEVFEGVWKVFTSTQEKENMLKDFRNRKGSFTHFNGTEYSQVSYKYATEFQAKEAMADEFAEYILTGEKPVGNSIGKFFTDLWNFIKSILSGQIQSVDQLFSKIDSGKYKSVAYNPIGIDESVEYRLADENYQTQYDTVRGVALQLMNEVLNPENEDSVSLTEFEESVPTVTEAFQLAYNKLEYMYTDYIPNESGLPQEQIKGYLQYWENIKNDWDSIQDLVTEYLKTFGIVPQLSEERIQDDRTRNENYSNRDYVDDDKYFANDAKNTASRSIKLLFAILPETITNSYNEILDDVSATTYLPQQVQYAKTFNSLLYQLLPINNMLDKEQKLNELGEQFPNFRRLYGRLMLQSNDRNPNSQLNDWKLRVRFFSVMSKQAPTAYTQFNQADGTSRTGTTNLDDSIKAISQSWIDQLKAVALDGSKIASQNDNGELILHTKELSYEITTLPNKIAFLNQLTIPFTQEMYERLSGQDKSQFNDAITGLASQLKKDSSYNLNDTQSLKSTGNLNKLAEVYIKAGNDHESTYSNMEGERRTKYISTNKISRDINDINNASTLEELYESLPHLRQVNDSLYLSNILFREGERTSYQLNIGYIEGTIDSKGKPIPGERLSISDRMVQEINQNLSGRYYILVPADSKTQWLVNLQNTISFRDVAASSNNWREAFLSQMVKYYNTEKLSYLNRRATNQRVGQGIFKDLSNNYEMDEQEFSGVLDEYINSQVDTQKRALLRYQTLVTNKAGTKWNWKNLDSTFLSQLEKKASSLTQEDVNNILTFRTVNYMINNVELQKMFFGDILEYKDPTKRYKLFLSPREVSVFGVPEYNDFLNEKMNEGLPETAVLGYSRFSDIMKTVSVSDVITRNEELAKVDEGYNTITSTDAQAYSTITGMRQRRLKTGNWTAKDEQQYQYMMARDRQLMLQDQVISNLNYPSDLQKKDKELVEKGNPNSSYVYVEKPIVSGHTSTDGIYHPIVDKFSIVSFSYASIRNSNFRPHYIKMMKQEINYMIMDSGRKVGRRTSDSLYNTDGTVNREPFTSIINIPFSTFGVQTDTSSKKEQQTRGTQVTKLVIVNLYNAGVPISEEAGQLAQENISLLKELTDIGYQKLLKQIGAEDVNGEFRIVNKTKILNLVTKELLRREVADSIKQLLRVDTDGQLITAFEALPNYLQIKNILYSYVDKNITSPKVSGSPKVQVSGALMEKYGVQRKVVNGKSIYYSSGLKFYTKDKPYCEVLLPFWVGQELRKQGLSWNNEEELFSIISQSEDVDKILSGVGFRIPTQELNSVENFRIAGFLPEEMGDTIIVPEEITMKAGSDFDIDKLNSYLKNLYVDKDKQVRIVPYFGMGQEARTRINRWLTENALEDLFKFSAKDKVLAFYDEQPDIDTDIDENEIDRIYRQSIENEYFDNMRKILELPNNFERLVTPNTTATLTGIRNILHRLAPSEFRYSTEAGIETIQTSSVYPTIINSQYMLDTRHNGQVGKGLVGIAAVAQTGTAISQLSPIILDSNRIDNLVAYKEKKYIGNNSDILLPHNQIDGKPTISMIKDQDGVYITDKISQYINGTVDVFNDAFLAQINFNRKTAGVYLMLERLGVPNSTTYPIVSLFMNQPIIRKFIELSDVRGINYLLNDKLYRDIYTSKLFSSPRKMETLPTSKQALVDLLRDNIEKFYDGGQLSNDGNASQKLILDEFLKYVVYAQNLFRLQQGTNYDTASMNDSYSVKMKEIQTQDAMLNNVWSSPDILMSNTFIQDQREKINAASTIFGDIFQIENPITQKYLYPYLEVVAKDFLSQDEKLRIMRSLEESLINYVIQTKTGINNSLEQMLMNSQTALVNRLKVLKKQLKNSDDRNIINGNVILNQLIPYIRGNNSRSTKNITLAVKARDIYTKNLYNNSFKELINNPLTQDIARSLIKLSFLQSGISNSPISYKDAIPADKYAATVNVALPYLRDEVTLQNFNKTGSFFRNNNNNENIVDTFYQETHPIGDHVDYKKYLEKKREAGEIPEKANVPSILWVEQYRNDQYVNHIETVDTGESTYQIKRLFKRVEDINGKPVVRPVAIPKEEGEWVVSNRIMYIQINKWGDDWRAQEHYDNPKMSVFNNGYYKLGYEVDPQDLAAHMFTVTATVETEPEPVEREITFTQFRNGLFDMIINTKDSSFDWRITIPDLSQEQRERAISKFKEGKTDKSVEKLMSSIQEMFDNKVVSMNRGRGNNAESVDFPMDQVFGGLTLSDEEFTQPTQKPKKSVKIKPGSQPELDFDPDNSQCK